MAHFVIFLADISQLLTEFLLVDTNCNVQSEYINSMSTTVFDFQNYDVYLKTAWRPT